MPTDRVRRYEARRIPKTQSPLSELCAQTGLKLPSLLKARSTTADRLARRTDLIAGVGLPQDCALIFVGSWGRQEVTSGSDNDFYLLAKDEPGRIDADVVRAVREALAQEEREFQANGGGFRGPGREGTFGGVVALRNLLERIGRNSDSNSNFTHRMLLVLESVALHNPDLHRGARGLIIENYLEAPIKPSQPPRLFLNDVVRYWRTMCVDFVGKMRERAGQGWGLRNVKLRTTRKMLFASGLLPILRCGELQSGEIEAFLKEQFERPPADRVADAFLELGEHNEGARVFGAYERFLQRIDSQGVRKALDDISSRAEADESKLFQSVARIGDEVEEGLLKLLFGSRLHRTTRRFGIF